MKLACASGAFHRAIERGDLTQLEFLDLCARELACDGVVLDVRHFPRTDDDYLAQIKKMATDRGLDVAALADPAFFSAATRRRVREVARPAPSRSERPLVAAPLARETERLLERAARRARHAATALAKAANVTLALRNAPGTFAATLARLQARCERSRFGLAAIRPGAPSRSMLQRPCGARSPNAVLALERLPRRSRTTIRSRSTLEAFPRVSRIPRARRARRAHATRRARCERRCALGASRSRSEN